MKAIRNLLINTVMMLVAWCAGTVVAQTTVLVPDHNLETAIRVELAKPTGPLTAEDLGKLRSLLATRQNIINLSGLEWATNLVSLGLSGNAIQDLSPLVGLTNLNYLELRANPLTNYTLLTGLRNLTTLYLGDTSVSNISFLMGLPRLDFVNLDHNGISSLGPLAALSNLRGLDLGYNPLTNLTELNALTNLQRLYLSGNSLSNLAGLTGLCKLTSLTLYNNQITDLSPLAGLTNLTELGLSGNPIGDYSVLMGLTNLTSLWLGDNAIGNMNFFNSLKALKVLDLSDGRLIELDGLEELTNLMVVFAENNRLTDISGIQDLPNLLYVSLSGNMLDLDTGSPATLVIEDLLNQQVNVIYQEQNQLPDISVVPQWMVATNATSTLMFYIADDITPNSDLVVTAHSSNAALVPNQNISIVNVGGARLMSLMPAANQTGTTEITLSVMDEAGASDSATVQVMVVMSQQVTIPDPHLEAAIRQMLNKPNGALDNLDLLGLSYLELFNPNITNLSGLEWAANLNSLSIDDAFSLSLLPLVDLPNLVVLSLQGVSLSDFWRLSQMPQLTFLELDNDRIFDLTPLIGFTNLSALSLRQNLLTNIVPLLGMPKLILVNVTLNLLDLETNSPTATHIKDLENQGVIVRYLPQREPPSISVRPTWVIVTNEASALSFGVKDDQVLSNTGLSITARSSNTNLLPNENIVIGKSANADWFLYLTPKSNQIGSTTITLAATNDAGLGTNAAILTTVVTPLSLDDSLSEGEDFLWTTGGNASWFGQSSVSHDGVSAARSGSIQNDQETWMQTTFEGPGILTFWWKVSSEYFFDRLEFHVNGELQPGRISGEEDWQKQTHNLPRGRQEVRWRYFKEAADSRGLDTAWVDEISYTPLSWLELVSGPANGRIQLLLHPVVGRTYLLQSSTNLSHWFHLSMVVGTNSSIPFMDGTASSTQCFYRLQELSTKSIWLQNPKRTGEQFQFELHSPIGLRFEIQASTNLVNWFGVKMVTNNLGAVTFTNPPAIEVTRQFYRALLVVP